MLFEEPMFLDDDAMSGAFETFRRLTDDFPGGQVMFEVCQVHRQSRQTAAQWDAQMQHPDKTASFPSDFTCARCCAARVCGSHTAAHTMLEAAGSTTTLSSWPSAPHSPAVTAESLS